MTVLNVLVVEDDAMIGLLLSEMLTEMGYHVCAVAATEDDAVSDATRYKPGLMIVDMQLREGTGVAAMSRILGSRPMPHVFMTGAPVPIDEVGATVLRKPFLEPDLARAIKHVVGDIPGPATPPPGAPQIVGKY